MRGGARQNAGRKRGIPNKTTQTKKKQLAAEGVMPLDVMLKAMRFHHEVAMKAIEQEPPDLVTAIKAMEAAREPAKDAAPYCHSRLATTEISGDPDKPIQHKLKIEFIRPGD